MLNYLRYPRIHEAAWGELLRPFKRRPDTDSLAVLGFASICPPRNSPEL